MFPLQFVATLWKICKSESVYRRHNVHFRVWIQAHKSLISVAWRSHAFSSVFNNAFDCTNISKEHFCWQRKGQTEDAALQNEISLFTLHDNEYNLISDPADQRLMPAKRDLFNEFGKLIAKIKKKNWIVGHVERRSFTPLTDHTVATDSLFLTLSLYQFVSLLVFNFTFFCRHSRTSIRSWGLLERQYSVCRAVVTPEWK